jgi:hypothetical protein
MTALQQCRDLLVNPLFLLHTGAFFDGERNDWDIEANSGFAVDKLADANPNARLNLYALTAEDVAAVNAARTSQPANRIGFCVCPRHDFAIVADSEQGCVQCNAEQLQTQPEPCGWLFDPGPGNEGASFFEIGSQQPKPESGFALVPLYLASNVCQEARIEDQAALRKDAERYRYARLNSYIEVKCDSPRMPGVTPEDGGFALDAEIDAAIATESAP